MIRFNINLLELPTGFERVTQRNVDKIPMETKLSTEKLFVTGGTSSSSRDSERPSPRTIKQQSEGSSTLLA